jgi:hypothetical protein
MGVRCSRLRSATTRRAMFGVQRVQFGGPWSVVPLSVVAGRSPLPSPIFNLRPQFRLHQPHRQHHLRQRASEDVIPTRRCPVESSEYSTGDWPVKPSLLHWALARGICPIFHWATHPKSVPSRTACRKIWRTVPPRPAFVLDPARKNDPGTTGPRTTGSRTTGPGDHGALRQVFCFQLCVTILTGQPVG